MSQRNNADRAILALWCRELGTLLKAGVPMLGALEVVAQEIDPLAAVTVSLEASIQTGDSLAQRMAAMDEVFPPLLRAAVLAGEAHDCVPETLLEVADCLAEAAALGVARTPRERLAELAEREAAAPAVVRARALISSAIEMGASRLRLTGGADGGVAEVHTGGRWQTVEEIDRGLFATLCRRIKLMADIPYWISEPAVGTIRLNTADHGSWDVAVQAIPDDDGVGQQIEMTLVPR